jgi:hypothetical protein
VPKQITITTVLTECAERPGFFECACRAQVHGGHEYGLRIISEEDAKSINAMQTMMVTSLGKYGHLCQILEPLPLPISANSREIVKG